MRAVDDRLDQLLRLAFRTVPAAEANQAIDRARRSEGGSEESPARSYEVVLGPGADFASFTREQLPKLVYHLESIGAHLPEARGVLLAVFSGSELRFLHAGEAMALICALLGETPAQLVERYGTGEVRTAVRPGPPLALPGPKANGSS